MSSENEVKKINYRGDFKIGDINIDCAVLEDGTRLISKKSVFECFGRTLRGLDISRQKEIKDFLDSILPNNDLQQIPSFIDSKAILSLIKPEIIPLLQGVNCEDGGIISDNFFKCEILPEMCGLYLEARRKGTINRQQKQFAIKSEILLEAFAKVGIAALIDEATGFQYNRKNDALRELLKQYIAEGIQKWIKRFPDKFFEELDRLYKNEKTTSRKRPMYYGNFINEYIYQPIENGYIKIELNKLNITEEGKRRARFHQWLTTAGATQLTYQIGRVMGVMEDSDDLEECKLRLARQQGLTIIERGLFWDEEKIIKKKKQDRKKEITEENNIKSDKFIQNIQVDNLEFKDTDFESEIEKIALSKKKD